MPSMFMPTSVLAVIAHAHAFVMSWINFFFLGSKSVLGSSKTKPYICGVRSVCVEEYQISGRVFYPAKRAFLPTPGVPWFVHNIGDVIWGKVVASSGKMGNFENAILRVIFFASKLVPSFLLPKLPNTIADGEYALNPPSVGTRSALPLVVWSHGRGGNVHDHALLLSQLAVEVPCIAIGITHTDGTADTWLDALGKTRFYRHPIVTVEEDRCLSESVQMHEYQVQYRLREIFKTIDFVREKYPELVFDNVVIGGFDFGGAAAIAAARCPGELVVAAGISVDGTTALYDKFPFPKCVFEQDASSSNAPCAFVLSDEWTSWNSTVTANTHALMNKNPADKLITVKQTKHQNFTECMYWIPGPLLIVLQLLGVLHKRGCPRKTYRRTGKWLVALIQQYCFGDPAERASSEEQGNRSLSS